MPIDDETLWNLCRDKPFRHRLVAVSVGFGLARQIRALRKQRGWTLKELGRRSGVAWTTVARYERWCGNASFTVLLKIAAAFDCGLHCGLVSWRNFFLSLGRADVSPSFDEEIAQVVTRGGAE